MTGSLGTKANARTFELEELVSLVRSGEVRVPDFQRPLRWGSEDVLRLFDSVVRDYPIGSLLLWARPAPSEELHMGDLKIDAPQTDRAYWVVDGQQRLTSLANTLSPDIGAHSRFALSFDLEKQLFVSTASSRSPLSVSIPILFDLQRLLSWFRDNPEASDYFDVATRVAKTIRQYRVPAYVVEGEDEVVLRDIFDRLNNFGKRLTRAEVFTALHTGKGDGSKTTVGDIESISADLNQSKGFGVIDGDTVLRAILARRAPDITREIRSEFDEERRDASEFPGEDVRSAFEGATQALNLAIDFLQGIAGVPHFSMLPYRYLLVVLTRVFAHFPDLDDRELVLLRRWFWRTASAGPSVFPGSTTGAMRVLCSKVIPGERQSSLRDLLLATPKDRVDYPSVDAMRTNYASGKILCCAMWSLKPRSLNDASLLSIADLAEAVGEAQTPKAAVVNIVSRRLLPDGHSESAGNRILSPGVELAPSEIAQRLIDGQPNVDIASWHRVLASYGLTPSAVGHLQANEIAMFIETREDTLKSTVADFLTKQWEFSFEDTPSLDRLVIDEDEGDDTSEDGQLSDDDANA